MEIDEILVNIGPRVRLGDLPGQMREEIYDILLELQTDVTLEDGRDLSFMVPLYLQAFQEGNKGARERIEALALQIGQADRAGRAPHAKAAPGQKKSGANSVPEVFSRHKETRKEQTPVVTAMPPAIRKIEEKIERREMLDTGESRAWLEFHQKAHAQRVRENGPIENGPIRHLILTCSDARVAGAMQYQDYADGTRILYVAGNVADVLTRADVAKLMEELAPGALISVVGHTHCGAVACAGHAHDFQKTDNIPRLHLYKLRNRFH